jgi:sigma-B regulation protein RsbU (phosphoserine phosphatase)
MTTGAGPQLEFECLSGPHPASFSVRADKPISIGRAATSDVCLAHEAVSRRHAMIVPRSGEWFVVDHNSRVGTFLNGVKLEAAKPAALAPGDLLRVGPWTFRAKAMGAATAGPSTVDDTAAREQRVERVGLVQSRADKRMRLLAECMMKLAGASDEKSLARSAIESALEGSGFARGAMLRRMGSAEEVELVESVRRNAGDSGGFEFSRSLVRSAAAGETGVLTKDRSATMAGVQQHSIAELRIHSAMCAPVFLGGAVEGYLYLDARGQEQSVNSEAAGYCEVVARAYGLAIANLKRIELQARHSTLERDLEAAREAQQVMLPPAQGSRGPIAYASEMRPGLFVAGDMFDVVPLDGGRVAVCVGDVAGHGVGSAMLMALAQSYLHAQLVDKGQAGPAVTAVNRFVAERSTAGRFASLWVGVFSKSASGGCRVEYVDAGHGHWLKSGGAGAASVEFRGEIPIGIEPEREFRDESLELGRGERLLLYSDGIVEQRSAAGAEFGKAALAAALAGAGSAAEDVKAAFAAIDAHSGGGNLDDDATVVSVEPA